MSVLVDLLVGGALGVPVAAGGYLLGRRAGVAECPVSGAEGVVAVRPVTPHSITGGADVSQETLRTLKLLRSGWMLVDPSDRVVAHSNDGGTLGLLRDVDLRHTELRDLVRRARRERRLVEAELDLALGPINEARLDLRVRVAPLTDDLVTVLIEDRTHARRIEETRRDFVVNVSHELKTPVGGLRLLAEAVEDAANDPDAVARFAARMKTETVRLSNLVQAIVDLSWLQGADTIADATFVDLADCAERAAEETRLLAENRGIALVVHIDDGSHVVLGDESLLTTAIRNLVNNAVNYSEAGTRIVVQVSMDDEAVVVQVTDQGIGLSAADVERIFERFYRVDPARSRQTGGTGLGLAIVKHVCANHGGQIRVWSEPGIGSTFEMQIPARASEALAASYPSQGTLKTTKEKL